MCQLLDCDMPLLVVLGDSLLPISSVDLGCFFGNAKTTLFLGFLVEFGYTFCNPCLIIYSISGSFF